MAGTPGGAEERYRPSAEGKLRGRMSAIGRSIGSAASKTWEWAKTPTGRKVLGAAMFIAGFGVATVVPPVGAAMAVVGAVAAWEAWLSGKGQGGNAQRPIYEPVNAHPFAAQPPYAPAAPAATNVPANGSIERIVEFVLEKMRDRDRERANTAASRGFPPAQAVVMPQVALQAGERRSQLEKPLPSVPQGQARGGEPLVKPFQAWREGPIITEYYGPNLESNRASMIGSGDGRFVSPINAHQFLPESAQSLTQVPISPVPDMNRYMPPLGNSANRSSAESTRSTDGPPAGHKRARSK